MTRAAARRPFRWRALLGVAAAVRSGSRADGPSVGDRLASLPRMLLALRRGEYSGTDLRHVALMVAAAGYVVSPVDLLPEGVLLLAGIADDALVVGWLAVTLVRATDDFLDWEANRAAVRSEVVR